MSHHRQSGESDVLPPSNRWAANSGATIQMESAPSKNDAQSFTAKKPQSAAPPAPISLPLSVISPAMRTMSTGFPNSEPNRNAFAVRSLNRRVAADYHGAKNTKKNQTKAQLKDLL